MACDGILNASVKLSVDIGGVVKNEANLAAVCNLLKERGHQAQTCGVGASYGSLSVDGVWVTIYPNQISAASKQLAEEVKQACEEIAGALLQERLAVEIAGLCPVQDMQYANGHIVMKINL